MRFARVAAWLALGSLAGACRPGGEGRLEARWRALDTALGSGSVTLPLQGAWCASRGRLTLLGVSGDTGVGILVRTVRLAPGLFPATDTLAARAPGSTIAFRLANRSSLFTLSGDSGAVALTSVSNDEVAGRFVGWFSRPDGGPVVLQGSFSGVSAAPDTLRCESTAPPAPVPAAAPDSGVT